MDKELKNYIKSHNVMQLATASKAPWICTLFYAADDRLNIYFVSDPGSRHCTDIAKNSSVACAITDTGQKITSRKEGVQIEGVASQIKPDGEIRKALSIWNRANPGLERTVKLSAIKGGEISDRPFIIRPSRIKFFSEKLYGTDGSKIFKV